MDDVPFVILRKQVIIQKKLKMCQKKWSFLWKTVTKYHRQGNRCLQANDRKKLPIHPFFRRIRQLFCTVGTLFLIHFLHLPPLIPRVSNFAKMREEGGGVLSEARRYKQRLPPGVVQIAQGPRRWSAHRIPDEQSSNNVTCSAFFVLVKGLLQCTHFLHLY